MGVLASGQYAKRKNPNSFLEDRPRMLKRKGAWELETD